MNCKMILHLIEVPMRGHTWMWNSKIKLILTTLHRWLMSWQNLSAQNGEKKNTYTFVPTFIQIK